MKERKEKKRKKRKKERKNFVAIHQMLTVCLNRKKENEEKDGSDGLIDIVGNKFLLILNYLFSIQKNGFC